MTAPRQHLMCQGGSATIDKGSGHIINAIPGIGERMISEQLTQRLVRRVCLPVPRAEGLDAGAVAPMGTAKAQQAIWPVLPP